MQFNTKFLMALAVIAASGTANATLSLVETAQPVGTTSLATAIGTFNVGNQKARLEAAGQSTVQGGNPGNGWWGDGTPTTTGTTPVRSWEVNWNNAAGTVTFLVYSSSDWSGTPAMSMTQTPVLTAGNTIVGLNIGGRTTSTAQSVKIDNVMFDGDGGTASYVDVNTAEDTYTGNFTHNDFHAVLGGPLGDFSLRGTTLFPTGTTTGDSMRFFVDIRQGAVVPEPSTYVAGALAVLPLLVGGVRKWRQNRASKA
jgi:hypothetical protein